MNHSNGKKEVLRNFHDAFEEIVIWWTPHGKGTGFLSPFERQSTPAYWQPIEKMATLYAGFSESQVASATMDLRRTMNAHDFHVSLYQAVIDDIRILASAHSEQPVYSGHEAVYA